MTRHGGLIQADRQPVQGLRPDRDLVTQALSAQNRRCCLQLPDVLDQIRHQMPFFSSLRLLIRQHCHGTPCRAATWD